MTFTIAIDGPAAAGKGTLSRAVAAEFGLAHLDTGLLYRAVARITIDTGADPIAVARMLRKADLEVEGLRDPEVSQEASKVSAIPAVRAALTEFQKSFARREGGAVLDGRDIGTVICPEAELKLYVTASDEVRAGRRFDELKPGYPDLTYEAVLCELRERDARDSQRATAPLKPAEDAIVIDTSDMTIADAIAAALKAARARMVSA